MYGVKPGACKQSCLLRIVPCDDVFVHSAHQLDPV